MRSVELEITIPAKGAFQRIRRHPNVFWLDGPLGDRPSFMSFVPQAQLAVWPSGEIRRWGPDGTRTPSGDPLEHIEKFVAEGDLLGWPTGIPGTIGFFAYDLAALIERRIRPRASVGAPLPLAWLTRYGAVVECVPLLPGMDSPCRLVLHATDRSAGETLQSALSGGAGSHGDGGGSPQAELVESPEATRYLRSVERALAYIAAGDVYQVNLAGRFVVRSDEDPADVYLRLRGVQPVPRGMMLRCDDFSVLCNSPERFLSVRGDEILTEPIKGTRPRHDDPTADLLVVEELQADVKERAEHVMIVDLERSDLGRICEPGSVAVTSLRRVESYATLHHLVSSIRGRLRPRIGLARILRATFPGGSITGAPKIRAAQVIAELEACGRGLYTGAVVWFRSSRDFDSAIAIRTAVARSGTLSYHAGSGIVADSNPRRELEECWLKAKPFLVATLGERQSELGPPCTSARRW
jgi:anthranilate/para-aminobenzoate synthase component I